MFNVYEFRLYGSYAGGLMIVGAESEDEAKEIVAPSNKNLGPYYEWRFSNQEPSLTSKVKGIIAEDYYIE